MRCCGPAGRSLSTGKGASRVINYERGTAMESNTSRLHVVQSEHGFRNDLGEMTETALYGHLQVRLGFDMNWANDFMSELEKNASVTLYSEDGQIRLEVRRAWQQPREHPAQGNSRTSPATFKLRASSSFDAGHEISHQICHIGRSPTGGEIVPGSGVEA